MGPRPAFLSALLISIVLAGCGGDDGPPAPPAEPPPAAPLPAEIASLDPRLAAAMRKVAADVNANPLDPTRWRGLAMLYHGNDFVEQADACYATSTRLDARDAEAWYAWGLVASRHGDAATARARVERSIDLDPTYVPAYWRMGQWFFAEGDFDSARTWYTRCTEAGASQASGWIGLARVHLQRGEAEPAARILEERILMGPNDGYGRQLLASAYNMLGREDEARVLASQGRGAQPAFPDPRWLSILGLRTGRSIDLERANSLVRGGRAQQAVQMLEGMRRAFPDDAVVLSNLAFALLRTSKIDEAMQRAREAAALDPSAYRPLLVQAMASEAKGGDRGSPEALALTRSALSKMPTAVDALSFEGLLCARAGDGEGALDAYRRASAQAPDNTELLSNVALTERGLGLYDDAAATYERLLRIAPSNLKARVGMAAVRKEAGDLPGAEELLQGALEDVLKVADERHPDTRTILLRLSEVLDAQGKSDEADAVRRRIR